MKWDFCNYMLPQRALQAHPFEADRGFVQTLLLLLLSVKVAAQDGRI